MYVKGVGPKKAAALEEVGIHTIADLLHHFPRRYLDRSRLTPIAGLKIGSEVTVVGKVVTRGLLRARRSYYEVLIADDTGNLPLIWFGGIKYIENRLKTGMTISVSGTITDFHGPQLTHPDFEIVFADEAEEKLHTGRIIPLYPSTAGLKKVFLDSRGLRRIIKPALDKYADLLEDVMPAAIAAELELPPLAESVRQMHYPDSFDKQQTARRSLALRELFRFALLVIDRRARFRKRTKPHSLTRPDQEYAAIVKRLPFKLTQAQRRVIGEIFSDLRQSQPMQRLLQGDVGSGKTVVATLTMALLAHSGWQAALMAPTEILARQHYNTIATILEGSHIKVALLTGSTPASERREITHDLSAGEIDLVIGTHALLSEDIKFDNLAYVVVDEQHRFGVEQREALLAKGNHPDLMVMTATPIPRTLALTAYGDLDVSLIDQLPEGRKPVRSALRAATDHPNIYRFIRNEVGKGNQAFIIYPLVEESLKVQLTAATKAYEHLRTDVFPDQNVGLIHGQMKRDERRRTMADFVEGRINIMVATTVVEVGIDIPDATVILIEHAERFGLSQLHQLRGRVGRSERKSYCILVTEMEPASASYRRLEEFTDCTDGFAISELDLKLRGPGDLLGIRQSGLPIFRVADLVHDLSLILTARECALKLLDNKYGLSDEEKVRLNQYIISGRAFPFSSGVS